MVDDLSSPPNGWAVPRYGPAVWKAADVPDGSWIARLTEEQRAELAREARRAATAGTTLERVRAVQACLPSFVASAPSWHDALTRGRGFVLVRGFPVDLLEPDEVPLAYLLLGTQIGTPLLQNRMGDLITPIAADSRDPNHEGRRFRSRRAMDFHTDSADLVGLLCVRPGERGGASRLVSSGALYNRMLSEDPRLVAALYRPVAWDQHTEDQVGAPRWEAYAPIRFERGRPRIDYIGWIIADAQRLDGVHPLTEEQLRAIRLLEATAQLDELQLTMTFEAGDLQLIDDRVLLHARDAYEDPQSPSPGRLLLRLWLADLDGT